MQEIDWKFSWCHVTSMEIDLEISICKDRKLNCQNCLKCVWNINRPWQHLYVQVKIWEIWYWSNLINLIHFDQVWSNLIKFDPFWSSLIQFDQVWSNLIHFDQAWSSCIKFDPFWSSLIQFDQVSSNLIKFDPIWSSLNQSDQVWSNLSKFDPICSSFNVFLTYQCHQVLNDTHGRTETNYNT